MGGFSGWTRKLHNTPTEGLPAASRLLFGGSRHSHKAVRAAKRYSNNLCIPQLLPIKARRLFLPQPHLHLVGAACGSRSASMAAHVSQFFRVAQNTSTE